MPEQIRKQAVIAIPRALPVQGDDEIGGVARAFNQMTDALREALDSSGLHCETDEEHLALVRHIRRDLERGDSSHVGEMLVRAALIRKFLG